MNDEREPKRIANKNLLCKIQDCAEFVKARGLCNKHYDRARNNGLPIPDKKPITKFCTKHPDKPIHARGLCSPCYYKSYVLAKK